MRSNSRLQAAAAMTALLAIHPSMGAPAASDKTNWGRMKGFHSAGPVVSGVVKTGRNSYCPCGSNVKFKKCCGKKI